MKQSFTTWSLFLLLVSSLFACNLLLCSAIPAHALSRKIALLEHDGKMYRSFWNPQGRFARALEEKQRTVSAISSLKLSSGFRKSHFSKLSRKFQFPLYPSLVVKPFILVEELKWAIERYQTKKIKASVDQYFQLKDSPSAKSSTSQKRSSRKATKIPFLFSPYYRRLYGLHVEFQW